MFGPGGPTFVELVIQALSSTESGYDLLAPKFDRTPFRTPDAILRAVAEHTGPVRSIPRALDLCCGTGAAMTWLRPRVRDLLVGLDMSRGMLVEARRRVAAAEGDAEVAFVRGDALALPFGRTFDLVTSFGAFGHILEEDEPQLVDQVWRCLAPGGRFLFATGRKPPPSHAAFWVAHGFNAAMHVRNALIKPEFVMYYLTFALPRCRRLLEARGFSVQEHTAAFPAPFGRVVLVEATRPA